MTTTHPSARAVVGRVAPALATALVAAAFVAPSLAVPFVTSHLTDGLVPAGLTIDAGLPSDAAGSAATAGSASTAAPASATARAVRVAAQRGFTSRGGHPLASTSRGAWARWTVVCAPGNAVALRTGVGPDHGRLKVTVDGTAVDVVDTWRSRSGTATVWRRTLPSGPHTIVVANLGTPGRGTVALDALLVG